MSEDTISLHPGHGITIQHNRSNSPCDPVNTEYHQKVRLASVLISGCLVHRIPVQADEQIIGYFIFTVVIVLPIVFHNDVRNKHIVYRAKNRVFCLYAVITCIHKQACQNQYVCQDTAYRLTVPRRHCAEPFFHKSCLRTNNIFYPPENSDHIAICIIMCLINQYFIFIIFVGVGSTFSLQSQVSQCSVPRYKSSANHLLFI